LTIELLDPKLYPHQEASNYLNAASLLVVLRGNDTNK